jgi:hypothetical protein
MRHTHSHFRFALSSTYSALACIVAALSLAATACGGSSSSGAQGGAEQSGDGGTTDGGGGGSDGGASQPDAAPYNAIQLSACAPTVYTASVSVGGQAFDMLVDTGSTTLGVAGSACTTCNVTPKYMPGSSAVDKGTQVTSQYGSGSWTGEVIQDDVVIGGQPSTSVTFASITKQSGFFQTLSCTSKGGGMQGILGMGPAAAAVKGTNGYMDQLVATHGMTDLFAVELCETGGTLWLGGWDPAATTADPVYTPETADIDKYYYSVNFASVTFGGQSIPVATGQYVDAVVDTGTSIFIVPTAAFNSITAVLANDATFKQAFGNDAASWFANPTSCRSSSLTKAQLDAMLPAMTLVFGASPGVSVKTLPTESYLVALQGQWCPGMLAQDPGPSFPLAGILGSPVMRSNVVIFDRAQKRIGFAPHAGCK